MRKPGSEMYGISLEKKVEKILTTFFSSGNDAVTIQDVIKTLQKQGDFNFYRRVNNAVKNLQVEGFCKIETTQSSRNKLPIIIIRPL